MNVGDRVYYAGNDNPADVGTVLPVSTNGADVLIRWDRGNPDSCECQPRRSHTRIGCRGEWFDVKDVREVQA